MTRSSSATILLLVALTACAAAQTQEKELVGEVRVPVRDLDLRNEADGERLLRRIEEAAYEACGGSPLQSRTHGPLPSATAQAYADCRADAVARARAAIARRHE
jgi:UrcA family protein